MWTKLQTVVHHYTMKPSQPRVYCTESAPSLLHDVAKPALCLLYRKRSITTRWSQASPVFTVQKAFHHYTTYPEQPSVYCVNRGPSLHIIHNQNNPMQSCAKRSPPLSNISRTIPLNPAQKEVHHCPTYPKQSHAILWKKRGPSLPNILETIPRNPVQRGPSLHNISNRSTTTQRIQSYPVFTVQTGPPLYNVSRATLCLLF